MTLPKISIITPSYNQAPYIEATLRSVLDEQDYPNLEYWVIDGGSTDGTLDILRRYEGRLRWISEPDGGQADAINKGMRLATGDILAWMNSDDLYAPGALRVAGEYFAAHPETMFLYGDALAIDEHDASHGIRVHVRAADADYLVNTGDPIVQPASFWRREVWPAATRSRISRWCWQRSACMPMPRLFAAPSPARRRSQRRRGGTAARASPATSLTKRPSRISCAPCGWRCAAIWRAPAQTWAAPAPPGTRGTALCFIWA